VQYFLAIESVLKQLETPSVYHIKKDELYELDRAGLRFLQDCSSDKGGIADDDKFVDYCLREGLLTRDKVLLKRPPSIKSPVPSLRYLELQITDRCNLRCRHCYIGDKINKAAPLNPPLSRREVKGSELSPSQIKNILHEFEEMQGLRVMITGGEPLLHSKFEEINEILTDFFVRKVLFTNGVLLNKKTIKNLKTDEIQISIDGLEDAHDSLRGEGSFKSAMKGVKLSLDSGFDVSISTMVHSKNVGDFERMERLFKEIGIKDWTVDVPCITGKLRENPEFQISPEQGGKYLGYGYGEGLHAGSPGFGCGLHLMSVTADGKIAKCTFYSGTPAGTIKDGLREGWRRITPVKLKELKCDCEYIESCRGGCRYRAALLGNAKGKDLYRCAFYGFNE